MSTDDLKNLSPTDPELIDRIVNNIKSKGIFDQFRKDCLADVDTKPAYQNLQQRVNGTVTGFLTTQKWQHGLNKTQLRESLRRHTVQQAFLEVGVDRIVDQVVNPKVFSVFMPKVEDVVCECLGIEKPKPKPMVLNFQQFKKTLLPTPTLAPTREPVPVPREPTPPQPPVPVKEEEPPEILKVEVSAPIETKPPEPPLTPTLSDSKETVELLKDADPVSPVSVAEVLNNDDDSNTIDEMPLLAASMDSDSNRAASPELDSAPITNNTKIGGLSDSSDSHSLLSTHRPLEYESSTNNLSSLKSEDRTSPLKKFDNFSNLGEKLKQSDVNLRETSAFKKDEIIEISSDLTKSSENDTESSEMKVDIPCESNMSSLDALGIEPTRIDLSIEPIKSDLSIDKLFSEDSLSSLQSFKTKNKSSDIKDDRSHGDKHRSEKKSSSTKSKESRTEKRSEKRDESYDKAKDNEKRDRSKNYSSSKPGETKSNSKDDSKDKSRSGHGKDKQKEDKHRTNKEKMSHSADRYSKQDSEKEKKDRSENEDELKTEKQKVEDSKAADSSKHSSKKKKDDDKSKYHSKDSRDSRSHRKGDDQNKTDDKEKHKSLDKDKKGEDRSRHDHDKHKRDSSSKSSRSKTDDKKHKDDKKNDDDKNHDDDKKKTPRKRKSGRCEEEESKTKNSRRSSDRDSNGNAGGGSSKSKSTSSSHNGRKSSKSDKGRSYSKNKDSTNNSEAVDEACEDEGYSEDDETDEIDKMLMAINNSIEDVNQRVDVSELLNEPLKKPKIAKNFHEIRKIMQKRKDITRTKSTDMPNLPDVHSSGLHVEFEDDTPDDVELSEEVCNDDEERGPLEDICIATDANEEPSSIRESSVEKSDEISDQIVLKDCSIVVTDILKGPLRKSFSMEDTSTGSSKKDLSVGTADLIEDPATASCVEVVQGTNVSPNVGTEEADSEPKLNSELVSESESPLSQVQKVDSEAILSEKAECEVDLESNTAPSAVTNDELLSSSANTKTKKDCTITQQPVQNCRINTPVKENTKQNIVFDLNSEKINSFDATATNLPSQEFTLQDTAKGVDNEKVEIISSKDEDSVDPEENAPNISLSERMVDEISESSKKVDRNKMSMSSKDQPSSNTDSPLPSRSSKRSNAGSRMYAILEEFNEKISNKQGISPVSSPITRSTRRKAAKSEAAQTSENVLNVDVHSSFVNTNAKGTEDKSALPASSKSCSTDDGSDVSNKENDETNVTGNAKSQRIEGVSSEMKNIDTRSSKRRNQVPEKIEDQKKSIDAIQENNNITKGRTFVSMTPVEESESLSENLMKETEKIKSEVHLENKKLDTPMSNRPNTRRGLKTPLNSRNRRSDINSRVIKCTISNSDVLGSSGDNVDRPKNNYDGNNKSVESLKMDKENITMPLEPDNSNTDCGKGLVSLSHRRKSCPDILQPCELSKSNDQSASSTQKSQNPTSDGKSIDVIVNKEMLADVREKRDKSENDVITTHRSVRRSSTLRDNEKIPMNNDNGSRSVRTRRTVSLTSDRMSSKPASRSIPFENSRISESGSSDSSESSTTKEGSLPEGITKPKYSSESNQHRNETVSGYSNKNIVLDEKPAVEDGPTTSVAGYSKYEFYCSENLTSIAEIVVQSDSAEVNISRRSVDSESKITYDTVSDRNNYRGIKESAGKDCIHVEDEYHSHSNTGKVEEIMNNSSETEILVLIPPEQNSSAVNKMYSDSTRVAKKIEGIDVGGPSSSTSKNTRNCEFAGVSKRNLVARASFADSLLEDSSSSDFRGFSVDERNKDFEEDYRGFTDEDIREATMQLDVLKRLIANRLSSPPSAVKKNQSSVVTGQPRTKKMRLASEGVARSRCSEEPDNLKTCPKNPRKRNFSLTSSPDKDKKEVLSGQCKAESKDSGLCESPEQPSFGTEVSRKKVVLEPNTPGPNGVRTRKPVVGVSQKKPLHGERRSKREDDNPDSPTYRKLLSRNLQRYNANDLYKPRPAVGRESRSLKNAAKTESTASARPKRSR